MTDSPASSAPVDTVLLDMGGVIVDTRGTSALPEAQLDFRGRRALLALLRDRGRRRVRSEDLEETLFAPWRAEYAGRYERMAEADWSPHLERLRQRAGAQVSDLEMLAAWFGPYAESMRAIPGAAEAVAQLRADGLGLALVSNVPLPGELYRRRLEQLGLAEPFAALFFSYDAGSRKPSPRMVLEALAELGSEPARAVMVGDRKSSDVAAGRSAGVTTVWVRCDHARGPAADAEVDSISELPALLRSWRQA